MIEFLLAGSIQTMNLFKMEFSAEAVYAKDEGDKYKGKGIIDICEPFTLVLMGIGLVAVGSYMVLRFKKNTRKRMNHKL